MATLFRNKAIKDVGLVPIEVIENNAATQSTVIGAALTNLTEDVIYASVLVHDDTSIEGYFIKDVLIPPNSSLRALNAGEKLILAPENQLYIQADQDESLDAVISYVDIN